MLTCDICGDLKDHAPNGPFCELNLEISRLRKALRVATETIEQFNNDAHWDIRTEKRAEGGFNSLSICNIPHPTGDFWDPRVFATYALKEIQSIVASQESRPSTSSEDK